MLVKNIIEKKQRKIITTTEQTTIDEAMDLLIKNGIGCLPVIDEKEKPVGIISDSDIFKKIHETKGNYHDLNVADLMSDKLIVGFPDDEIEYIAGVMKKEYIRHIPIVVDDKLIGLVSLRDILELQTENIEIENRYLHLYSNGLHKRDRSSD